jgi:hypothetical protein
VIASPFFSVLAILTPHHLYGIHGGGLLDKLTDFGYFVTDKCLLPQITGIYNPFP